MTALPMTVPVRAEGLLGRFADAGVLVAADTQVARALGRLTGEADDRVLLAAALAVRSLRLGSVCVDLTTVARVAAPEAVLDDDLDSASLHSLDSSSGSLPELPWPESASWVAACAGSPMVATANPPGAWESAARDDARPLTLRGNLLFLDRYAQLEDQVRVVLGRRAARGQTERPEVSAPVLRRVLDEVFDSEPTVPDLQRLAVAAGVAGWVTVIAGGPGTGKTTTVARLLDALARVAELQGHPPLRVALAAPTGKAAARLKEQVGGGYEASTIHRLLGSRRGSSSRFAHDWQRRLPFDVVVVDETSMVSLELMARLLEALRPDTRLVLVGDPDQLVSVDAGAVLADLVGRSPRTVPDAREVLLAEVTPADLAGGESDLRRDLVRLRTNHRSTPAISRLAEAVLAGEADSVMAALSAEPRPDEGVVEWVPLDVGARDAAGQLVGLCADVLAQGRALAEAAHAGDVGGALAALGRHRLLCAHRSGQYGTAHWRELVGSWGVGGERFDVGRGLLVTANNPALRLWNGDLGVVVVVDDQVVAAFDSGIEPPLHVPLNRLGPVESPLAMTVHKAQGSEADQVSVVLPPPESRLLTRELLYTAVTRARSGVRVIGTEASIRAAVARRVVRASGLRT